MSVQNTLTTLPADTRSLIFLHVNPEGIGVLSATCKSFRDLIYRIQGLLLSSHFPLHHPINSESPALSYRKLVAAHSPFPGFAIDTILRGQEAIYGFFDISPDGQKIVHINPQSSIAAYDLNTRMEQWKKPFYESFDKESLLFFTAEGTQIVVQDDESLKLINMTTGNPLGTLPPSQNEDRTTEHTKITPDGKKLIRYYGPYYPQSGDNIDLKILEITNLETREMTTLGPFNGFIHLLQISPDSQTAYAIEGCAMDEEFTLHRCNLTTNTFVSIHTSMRIEWISADGEKALVRDIGAENPYEVWRFTFDGKEPTKLYDLHGLSQLFSLETSNQGLEIVMPHTLKIWDLNLGICRQKFKLNKILGSEDIVIGSFHTTPDMNTVLVAVKTKNDFRGFIFLLNVEKGICQLIIATRRVVDQVYINAEGTQGIWTDLFGNIKRIDFSLLPEERLAALANLNADGIKKNLCKLPNFAQKRIREINEYTRDYKKSLEIYTAEVSLPGIRYYLEQCLKHKKEPSELATKISDLPEAIRVKLQPIDFSFVPAAIHAISKILEAYIPGVIQESAVEQGCGNTKKVRGTFCSAEQVSEQRTGPEGSSDFLAAGGVPEDVSSLGCQTRDIALAKDRSEDEKYEAKATRFNRFLNHERYKRWKR